MSTELSYSAFNVSTTPHSCQRGYEVESAQECWRAIKALNGACGQSYLNGIDDDDIIEDESYTFRPPGCYSACYDFGLGYFCGGFNTLGDSDYTASDSTVICRSTDPAMQRTCPQGKVIDDRASLLLAAVCALWLVLVLAPLAAGRCPRRSLQPRAQGKWSWFCFVRNLLKVATGFPLDLARVALMLGRFWTGQPNGSILETVEIVNNFFSEVITAVVLVLYISTAMKPLMKLFWMGNAAVVTLRHAPPLKALCLLSGNDAVLACDAADRTVLRGFLDCPGQMPTRPGQRCWRNVGLLLALLAILNAGFIRVLPDILSGDQKTLAIFASVAASIVLALMSKWALEGQGADRRAEARLVLVGSRQEATRPRWCQRLAAEAGGSIIIFCFKFPQVGRSSAFPAWPGHYMRLLGITGFVALLDMFMVGLTLLQDPTFSAHLAARLAIAVYHYGRAVSNTINVVQDGRWLKERRGSLYPVWPYPAFFESWCSAAKELTWGEPLSLWSAYGSALAHQQVDVQQAQGELHPADQQVDVSTDATRQSVELTPSFRASEANHGAARGTPGGRESYTARQSGSRSAPAAVPTSGEGATAPASGGTSPAQLPENSYC